MKKFASCAAVKVICVILTPVLSFVSVFLITAILTGAVDWTFDETEEIVYFNSSFETAEEYKMYNFLQTEQCKTILEDEAYNLCSLFAYNEKVNPGDLIKYSIDNSNLQVSVYLVKDDTNESLFYNNRILIDAGLSTQAYLKSAIDPDATVCAKLSLDRKLTKDDIFKQAYESYYFMNNGKNLFIVLASVFSVLFIANLVILCIGVGRRKNSDTVTLNFYNRIPLEIIAAVYIAFIFLTARMVSFSYMIPLYYDFLRAAVPRTIMFSIPAFIIVNIIAVPFIVTMAARIKASTCKVLPFWKNFLILRILRFLITKLAKAAKFVVGNSSAVFSGAAGFIVYIIINLILILSGRITRNFTIILCIAFNICVLALICLFLSNFDRLKKETQALEKGEYTLTDSGSYMLFFRKFAESLNSTKEGMSLALEKSIKSERFKTELITNVSHDLKTPLTSIINYVDLMKNEDPNSPKAKEYLDILDKQSKRLKHLIEDLIEVSKASTGNIKAELSEIDIEEFLSQVNGEFFDRFESFSLTAVTEHSDKNLKITADGALLWRVFNNLYSNICKYSLPGTRVYISTRKKGTNAEITVKNISAQPLNITADELTERFVRGDSSRNTEGSGLGLSIAKSLTETQNGTFDIKIDGDLFKVIMEFPLCKYEEASCIVEAEAADTEPVINFSKETDKESGNPPEASSETLFSENEPRGDDRRNIRDF